MKGQPLSYDRISWPQQPKCGWQSINSVCGWPCVCVRLGLIAIGGKCMLFLVDTCDSVCVCVMGGVYTTCVLMFLYSCVYVCMNAWLCVS